jgi:DNA gyrase inhibitor GyrI
VNVSQEQWTSLMAWARRNNTVDYKFLLGVYKDRISLMDSQPKLVDLEVL